MGEESVLAIARFVAERTYIKARKLAGKMPIVRVLYQLISEISSYNIRSFNGKSDPMLGVTDLEERKKTREMSRPASHHHSNEEMKLERRRQRKPQNEEGKPKMQSPKQNRR